MSRASIPTSRSGPQRSTTKRLLLHVLLAAPLLACPLSELNAQTETPREPRVQGPLWGGTTEPPAAPKRPFVDPKLPTGVAMMLDSRPDLAAASHRLCSALYPLCLHFIPGLTVDGSAALRRLEASYRRVTGVLRLASPWPDLGASETAGFDVFLEPNPSGYRAIADAPDLRHDRASARCVIGFRSEPLEAELERCLIEAVSHRLDAAETPAARTALADHVRLALGSADSAMLEQLDDAQANPQLSLAPRNDDEPHAQLLLFEALAAAWPELPPAQLGMALFNLSRSDIPDSGPRFDNEPDLVDVTRRSLGGRASDFADWLGRLALSRALLATDPGATPFWRLGTGSSSLRRVRYDWRLTYSSLPRRVISARPIESLGMFYLWLDLDQLPLGARLGFRAEWEGPVAFKWMLLALDASGREMMRLDVPYLETQTEVERSWVGFEAASAIVIAGVNLGAVSPAHPFDPDHQPWEPHSCTVYLANLSN